MGLSLGSFIGMRLRGSPAGFIRKCARRLEKAGITVPLEHLEAHALAGGNLERVTEAMIAAGNPGTISTWYDVAALDLTGSDPLAAVRNSAEEQELAFDCYSPHEAERIVGFTRDRNYVEAAVRVRYRPSVIQQSEHVEHLQERLAVKVGIIINTAASPRELELRRGEHETHLLAIATEILSSVQQVQIKFRTGAQRPPDT